MEEGRLAGAYNLLSDGDFCLTVNNTAATRPRLWPQKWNKVGNVGSSTFNCVVLDRSENGLPEGVSGNALRLKCTPTYADVYMAQEVGAVGSQGDVFTIAGWCKADSVLSAGNAEFEPRLGIRFYGSSSFSTWRYIAFSTNRSGWHLIRQQVTAPRDYTKLQVGVFYSKNNNTAMFTHINLCRELYGNVYTYDDNGNPIAVKDRSAQQSAATYE